MLKKAANKLIGAILIEWGVIDQEQLSKALQIYNERKGQSLIGEILVELGFAKEEDIIRAFKMQYAVPYINIKGYSINREAINLIPFSLAEKYTLIPLDKVEDCLSIAMAKPLNTQVIKEISEVSHCQNVQIYVATVSEVKEAIDKYYPKLKRRVKKEDSSVGPAGEEAPSIPAQPAPGTPSAENTVKEPTPENKPDIQSDEHYFNIKGYNISREVINSVPVSLARKYKLIPIGKLEDCIAIAIADPSNSQAINAVKDASASNDVLVYVASVSEIKEAIDKYYPNS